MKAIEALKRLSWTMSLPFGLSVRHGDNLISDVENIKRFTYENDAEFEHGAWYLEIVARYESSALMEDFSTPDVICSASDGMHMYFKLED